MYKITDLSYKKANFMGVIIKPSKIKNKKIDVFKNNKKIASIGDVNYSDYYTYLAVDKKLAEKRKKLYKIRHNKDLGLAGFYANKLLWGG